MCRTLAATFIALVFAAAVRADEPVTGNNVKPVAENKTREGREKNRAVVMTVMVPKSEGSVASRNN